MGGDVVLIDTRDPVDASVFREVPNVVRLEQMGPNQVRATVADSSATLPDLVEAVTSRGGEVASASESNPSFDEVFAVLVERSRLERAREAEAARAGADDDKAA
jgi:hypothetical protein